ncbi:MAG: thiamine pyrophosphate-binding protein [Bacteroidetes Order II. Incertae sedis bacterium]|nr:thiamine pyrophosphate-binding protein [Bacteroidetes Order II. bacterium]
MKLSDYVMDVIADEGVKHVFMLPGGGAMHLNDSLGRSERLEYVCNLHEQACSIAADAYGQYTNNLGVCLVTTGPGCTNAITGVAAGWMDSTPMLVVSGQVKRADLCHGKGTRQIGFQEINIIPVVQSITKYAVTVTEPESIRYHLEKAIWLAQNGRPGPSWVDIPLDVQAAEVEPNQMSGFVPEAASLVPQLNRVKLKAKVAETLKLLSRAERPVILVGNGVRLSRAERPFMNLARRLNIPVLTTWKALDLLTEDDPLFIGRPGAVGQRYANLAQQNSDWLLMLGARMDTGQTAYMHQYLARNAKKIMVDIDMNEINKMDNLIDVRCPFDAGVFIREMEHQVDENPIETENWTQWWAQCHSWKEQFPMVLPEYWDYKDGVSVYVLVDVLSDLMVEGDLFIPGSSGGCSEVSMQTFKAKRGVRVYNSEGMGPMGFGISAALGGCIASGGSKTICIEGDGGFAMNTQELETVRRLNLKIKFFVLDNGGYDSIRTTQKVYFEGRFYGSEERGGLTLPELKNVAGAYGIHFVEMLTTNDIRQKVQECLKLEGPVICRVLVSKNHVTAPRVMSRQTESGSMETAPMEEMWP